MKCVYICWVFTVKTAVILLKSIFEFVFNPLSPNSAKINFLLTISIHCQEIGYENLQNEHLLFCFDLLSNSLNSFFKEIYKDQFGEFVCGYNGT